VDDFMRMAGSFEVTSAAQNRPSHFDDDGLSVQRGSVDGPFRTKQFNPVRHIFMVKDLRLQEFGN